MVTMNKIDSIKSGTFFLILSGILGLVFGVFTTGATLLGFSISKKSRFFSFFGRSAVFILPIFYGISGYLIALIPILLYNRMHSTKEDSKVDTSNNSLVEKDIELNNQRVVVQELKSENL